MNAQTRKMTAGLEYLGMALCGKAGNGDENMATSNAVTPTMMSNRPRKANHRRRLSMRLPLLVARMLHRNR